MNPLLLMKKVYKIYYSKFKPERVIGLPAREWAYTPFSEEGTMIRHISIKTHSELKRFLVENVPRNVYYSSAYYKTPNASTMEEKGWIGADLVFDIDADHIPWALGKKYDAMLEVAKKEMKHLIENFILSDFGFGENDLEIAFSGGRGYHLRISSLHIRKLSSSSRKEIADYVYGTDLDKRQLSTFLESGIFTNSGWPNKVYNFLKNAYMNGVSWVVEKFKERGMDVDDDSVRAIIKYANNIFGIKPVKITRAEKDKALDSIVAFLRSEIDKIVTGDAKRLLRYPSSLHGKTGLLVKKLTLDELDNFKPLEDAVVLPEKDSQVLIQNVDQNSPIIKALQGVRIKDYEIEIMEGVVSMPLYAAIFVYGLTGVITSIMVLG